MAYDASRATLNAFPGVPSDTNQISAFGFFVGGAGNVAVLPWAQRGQPNPTPVVFAMPAGGVVRDMGICGLMATGTTATGIVMFGPT